METKHQREAREAFEAMVRSRQQPDFARPIGPLVDDVLREAEKNCKLVVRVEAAIAKVSPDAGKFAVWPGEEGVIVIGSAVQIEKLRRVAAKLRAALRGYDGRIIYREKRV